MSVFQVTLNNIAQGYMDLNPATATMYQADLYSNLGAEMQPSIQRTIYVAGPNRTYRKLYDGQTFTDCNYWKRFAYPQVPLDQAFITVITDDGSVWSDVESENTYPKVYNVAVANGSTYTTGYNGSTSSGNTVNILGDTGGYAIFVQIANQSSTAVKVQLNGMSTAIFDLGAGETQVFNSGELSVTMIQFANTVSGGSTANIQVLVSVKSVCNS
jgi:hypothetical protein